MYASSNLRPRDRAGAMVAVIAIHAALAYAFLNLSGKLSERETQEGMQVFDVRDVPPPEPPPVVEQPEPERAEKKEGAAAPKNIESEASPVVAPKPRVVIPAPSPVIAAPIPRQGPDPSQGAAPVPGPGTGAGGAGTGTGSGGSGSGPGGGGGGIGTRPQLISRTLTPRDYPGSLHRIWPSGGRVLVIFNVQLNGRATDCRVHTSSGVPAIDQVTCSLVESRLRFRPARNARGEPFVEKFAYMQAPVNF